MAPTIINTEETRGGNKAEGEAATYAATARLSPRQSKWNKRNKTQASEDGEEATSDGEGDASMGENGDEEQTEEESGEGGNKKPRPAGTSPKLTLLGRAG